MNSTLPVAVVYHKAISGHWYTLARLAEVEGELIAIPVRCASGGWSKQYRNRRAAFTAARETGSTVHPFMVTEDYTRPVCANVKQLGG